MSYLPADPGRAARLLAAISRANQVAECELVLSIKKGSNGRVLNVRCQCMARTPPRPGRWRNYAYPPIGEAVSIEEAKALFATHQAERSGNAR